MNATTRMPKLKRLDTETAKLLVQAAVAIPSWLSGAPALDPEPPPPDKELLEMVFANFFEHLIDKVTVGKSLKSVLLNDHRLKNDFEQAAFMRWLKKDRVRMNRLREAQELHAEVQFSAITDIAENAPDSRSADSQIAAIKTVAAAYDRKRFGEKKEIEINQTIDLREVLAQAQSRVIEGTSERVDELE